MRVAAPLKKSLSQHLLRDRNLLDKMVRLAGVGGDDRVLEIGAGQGDLTRRLSAKAALVYAVELDERFRPYLEALQGENPRVTIIFGNILDVPFARFACDGLLKVMGNIPYNITGDILFKILGERRCVKDAFLTMQREVAERIVSRPHARTYGALSVILQLFAEVRLLLVLKPSLFVPPPKVESAYISIIFRGALEEPDEGIIPFVKNCFRYKRKYLRRALEEEYGGERVQLLYRDMGFGPAVRAEELEPQVFVAMHRYLS